MYLAIHEKLYTKDMLERWGLSHNTRSFCNTTTESHQHLFFECTKTGKILNKLLKWMSITRGNKGWQEEIEWATTHT